MASKANKRFVTIAAIFLVVIGLYLIISPFTGGKKREIPKKSDSAITMEPQFTKEGVLAFLNSEGDTLKLVDIEIADSEPERSQGMMYRSDMPYNQAMLFIMEYERPQTFWMRNTRLSLDIMYVNGEFEIVTIYKHTQPYSNSPIPSFKKAKYVVETKAGFCDQFGIEEGNYIAFSRVDQVKAPAL